MILLTAWTHLETRGRAGQGRRRRLPGQALGRPQAAGHRRQPARTRRGHARRRARLTARSRARGGERPARRATTCAASSSPSGAMERVVGTGLPGRARRRAGADHRSERCRQGTHRRDRAGQLARSRDGPFVTRQLRRAAVRADRSRAVRCRGRRLHRAPTRPARAASRRPMAARCSSTRSATCRWPAQMKLLRVLETGQFERLGSATAPARSRCA